MTSPHAPDNVFTTVGTLILEDGTRVPAVHVTCGAPHPDPDWFGSVGGGYCGAWSPLDHPDQCIGKPDHFGAHRSLSNDWAARSSRHAPA